MSEFWAADDPLYLLGERSGSLRPRTSRSRADRNQYSQCENGFTSHVRIPNSAAHFVSGRFYERPRH